MCREVVYECGVFDLQCDIYEQEEVIIEHTTVKCRPYTLVCKRSISLHLSRKEECNIEHTII